MFPGNKKPRLRFGKQGFEIYRAILASPAYRRSIAPIPGLLPKTGGETEAQQTASDSPQMAGRWRDRHRRVNRRGYVDAVFHLTGETITTGTGYSPLILFFVRSIYIVAR
jgi:hypothetical protein